jgi:hypothetical protein
MRHHEPLVNMRMAGFKPALIQLETGPFVPDWKWWPEFHIERAIVEIEGSDAIERLDLRFVLGCEVYVDGVDQRRVRLAFAAAQDHGAARVIGTCSGPHSLEFILDSEGVVTWHK